MALGVLIRHVPLDVVLGFVLELSLSSLVLVRHQVKVFGMDCRCHHRGWRGFPCGVALWCDNAGVVTCEFSTSWLCSVTLSGVCEFGIHVCEWVGLCGREVGVRHVVLVVLVVVQLIVEVLGGGLWRGSSRGCQVGE